MEFLDKAPLLYAGLSEVIRRGTAQLLENTPEGVFLRDTVSGAFMLAAGDAATGEAWLRRHEAGGYPLLVLFQEELFALAAERYGLRHRMDCLQAVYTAPEPPALPGRLTVRPAEKGDLPVILAHYDLLDEEEIRRLIARRSLFMGCRGAETVGFAGRHLEGSMGLLEILPPYRRLGYGAELEGWMIAQSIRQGMIPFCQVEAWNEKSLRLQKKLGLALADRHLYWLF